MSRELVNVSEAARRTGVPRQTIVSWVARGRLYGVGLTEDGIMLYDLDEIRRLVASRSKT